MPHSPRPRPTTDPEIFYLQVDDVQQGPYTVGQIDHLLNSGLIPPSALYWHENQEEWQPVTRLVKLRRTAEKWVWSGIAVGIAVMLLMIGRLFGPTFIEGWKENAQSKFSPTAAYWRARHAVRQAVTDGAMIVFESKQQAEVQLREKPAPGAVVQVRGTLADSAGHEKTRRWMVDLAYDPTAREWTGQQVKEEAP